MIRKFKIVNLIFIISYVSLISLLIFNISTLSDKYNKEETEMVSNIEQNISKAINSDSNEELIFIMDEALNEYSFDIVITEDDSILYSSIPYNIGDTLLGRTHPDVITKESQGIEESSNYFIWYSIYKLEDSVFLSSFLNTFLTIIIITTILVILTVYLLFRILYIPLNKVRNSIENAKEFNFDLIQDGDDNISHEFKTFVESLETNINAVSKQHILLEKQLQVKRERLNNLVVLSRSMIHNLKTPLHQAIVEFDASDSRLNHNDDSYDLLKEHKIIHHNLLLEINEIFNILSSDAIPLKIESSNVDVVHIIMKTLNVYRSSVFEKSLAVDFDSPEEVYIFTEEPTFLLLMNNIISNMVNYSLLDSELSIFVDNQHSYTSLVFSNQSTRENIEKMKNSQQLFNAISMKTSDYQYSSGNGLFIIKELTQMLNGEYYLRTNGDQVTIEVRFENE